MKKYNIFIVLIICCFQISASTASVISIYKKVAEKPKDSEMNGHGEEGQGITSNNYNRWFYSNKENIYEYDKAFSPINKYPPNKDRITTLDKFNDFIKEKGVTKVNCNHFGDIDTVGNYLYVAVDQCQEILSISTPTRRDIPIEIEISEEDSQKLNLLSEKYNFLSENINLSDEDYRTIQVLLGKYSPFLETIDFSSNADNDDIAVKCEHIGYFYVCYKNHSYIGKISLARREFVDFMEFKTVDGYTMSSAAWVALNQMDKLFYNQCSENIVPNSFIPNDFAKKELRSYDSSQELTSDNINEHKKKMKTWSVCGFDFDSGELKSMIYLGQDHPRELSGHWSNQGATFAYNGVFLYVQDDSRDDYSDNTGFNVYAPHYDEFITVNNIKIFNNTQRFAFGHISYNVDYNGTGKRKGELEGIHVWLDSPLKGDIHVLRIDNEGNTDDNTVYHFNTSDYDGDGYNDLTDNCPLIWNKDQRDSNYNGIGDACDNDKDKDGILDNKDNCPFEYNPNQLDSDQDTIGDVCDNCPLTPNTDQKDWNGKNGGDVCEDFDKDSWFDDKDACPNVKNKKGEKCDENCRKSTSDCCLKARKLCDMDKDGRWDEEYDFKQFKDDYAFDVDAYWGKSGADNCVENWRDSSKNATFWSKTCDVGYSLEINGTASYFRGMENSDAKISSYYCYCGNNSEEHRNLGRLCGSDHAHPNEVWDSRERRSRWSPLYVHGNNQEQKNFNKVVAKSELIQRSKIQRNKYSRDWEYQKDSWLFPKILTQGNDFYRANTQEEKIRMIFSGNYPMLKLSHGAAFSDKNKYVKGNNNDGYEINKLFFSNSEEYQKHIAGKNEELNLAKKSKNIDVIIEKKDFFGGYTTIPGYGKWYWEMLREYIGDKPWWKDLPFARQFEDIVKESLYETIARPSIFSRVSYNGDEIVVKAVEYPENYNQIFAYGIQDGIYYKEDENFKVAFSNIAGIFEGERTVQNGFEMRSAATLTHGTEIYMAAGMTVTQSSQYRNINVSNIAEEKPLRNRRFAKISFTNDGALMEELAELPWTPEYITLFEANDQIHAIMMNASGETSVLVYYSENNSWAILNTFNFGQVFSLNNTFVKDDILYFTAPNREGKTALYTWDILNGFLEIAHLDSLYDSFIKPFEYSGKIILADIKDISGKDIDSWKLDGGIFQKERISLDKPLFEKKFCINEKENSIFPGVSNAYSECKKVEKYNFKKNCFFDYKLSVAGYKNSLYLGGLTGIRRVEIEENGKLVKKDMIYS